MSKCYCHYVYCPNFHFFLSCRNILNYVQKTSEMKMSMFVNHVIPQKQSLLRKLNYGLCQLVLYDLSLETCPYLWFVLHQCLLIQTKLTKKNILKHWRIPKLEIAFLVLKRYLFNWNELLKWECECLKFIWRQTILVFFIDFPYILIFSSFLKAKATISVEINKSNLYSIYWTSIWTLVTLHKHCLWVLLKISNKYYSLISIALLFLVNKYFCISG